MLCISLLEGGGRLGPRIPSSLGLFRLDDRAQAVRPVTPALSKQTVHRLRVEARHRLPQERGDDNRRQEQQRNRAQRLPGCDKNVKEADLSTQATDYSIDEGHWKYLRGRTVYSQGARRSSCRGEVVQTPLGGQFGFWPRGEQPGGFVRQH